MRNLILSAALFAAEKHRNQRRKGCEANPYINHPIEVAEHLARVGGVTDEAILAAALLHDTIEDTETSPEEIREAFGETILGFVLECTDDKTLEKQERKRLQIVNAPHKSPEAKQIKLSDKICNLRALLKDHPVDWSRQRQIEYFQWAQKVIAGLRGINPALDEEADDLCREGLSRLS